MSEAPKKSRFLRALDGIERVGNRLPDPFILFCCFAAAVVLASWFFEGASVVNPGNQKTVSVQSLLRIENLRRLFTDATKNFTGFPPLGAVLVVMMGVGLAEKSGLFAAGLRQMMSILPKSAVVPALVFAGVNSSIAADAGIVVLPPLGALLFISAGKHPLAGISAAFAGVSGGFSANLLITSLDPLLSGLTEAAARLIDPTYSVAPTCNWYFMFVSTFVLTAVGALVTTKIIEPRLGPWKPKESTAPNEDASPSDDQKTQAKERRGVLVALLVTALASGVIALLTFPEGALFQDEKGELKPFFESIVPLLALLFVLAGVSYGVVVGSIKSHKDAVQMASDAMASMGGYILLAFAAAQFIAYFNWSNIGVIIAVKGAGLLKSLGLTGGPLLVGIVLISIILDLLVASASAKWAVLAPIFVPMLMLLGYSPEVAQAAYRVGDSVCNIMTPLMPYFPILVMLARKYAPEAGVGTILSLMLPYSLAFMVMWSVLLLVWFGFGIPFGPGAPLSYPP